MSLKEVYQKHREVVLYLVFGVLTTLVGWVTYFAVLIPGKSLFGIAVDDTSSGRYFALYTAAQIFQWICAVLFAFFTNRKFVFSGAQEGRPGKQLLVFAGGRVATFVLDYFVTYAGAIALSAVFPGLSNLFFLGKERNLNELLSKIVAAVLVIVGNYFFSKFLVFRKRGNTEKP